MSGYPPARELHPRRLSGGWERKRPHGGAPAAAAPRGERGEAAPRPGAAAGRLQPAAGFGCQREQEEKEEEEQIPRRADALQPLPAVRGAPAGAACSSGPELAQQPDPAGRGHRTRACRSPCGFQHSHGLTPTPNPPHSATGGLEGAAPPCRGSLLSLPLALPAVPAAAPPSRGRASPAVVGIPSHPGP